MDVTISHGKQEERAANLDFREFLSLLPTEPQHKLLYRAHTDPTTESPSNTTNFPEQ